MNLTCITHHDGGPVPAVAFAPQSYDQGATIDSWQPVCEADARTWFDVSDWVGQIVYMDSAEHIGRAIHAAKRIGGPWGPPCTGFDREQAEFVPVYYGYDSGEFECECPQMGAHLLEIMHT